MAEEQDNLSILSELTDRLLEAEREKDKYAAELIKSAKIWSQTFDAIQDCIFITNTRLEIVKANRAFAELIGSSSPDTIIGKRCIDIFKCQTTNYGGTGKCIMQQITEEGFQPVKREVYLTQQKRWFELRVFFANHDINGFIHIMRDITLLKD